MLQLNFQYKGTGADRCARELYEDLPNIGIQTALWVGERKQGEPPEVRGICTLWERITAPMEAFPDLTDWRHRGSIASLRGISKETFDLVHIHNIHSGWISVRAVEELARRFPCVWTLHDEWAPKLGITYDLTGKLSPSEVKRRSHGLIRYIPYHRYHENFKWRRTRKFLRKWLPQPKIVICPSLYMLNLAESTGVFPDSEMIHIPLGTRMLNIPESQMQRDKAKHSFGFAPDRPVVVMISADLAQAHKGISLGIEAIKRIDQHHGLQVLLLGRSGQQIADALQPLPSVCAYASDDATLARAYRAADVMLTPSLGENFPYVGLESLACGTPLLAFQVGGLPEIIGKNERGVVCEKIAAGEMSRHLNYLISTPEVRNEMGNRGVKWARENCGMAKYLASIVRVYERVLGASETAA